jgi:hypothetical protein
VAKQLHKRCPRLDRVRKNAAVDIVAIYAMLALGFPAAWLSTAALGWLFLVFSQHAHSPSAITETLLIWIASFAFGYCQWFILLPAIIKRFRK